MPNLPGSCGTLQKVHKFFEILFLHIISQDAYQLNKFLLDLTIFQGLITYHIEVLILELLFKKPRGGGGRLYYLAAFQWSSSLWPRNDYINLT